MFFFSREAKRLATAASHQRKEQLPPPGKKKYFSLFQIYYFLTGCWPAAVITFSILSCAVREPGYLHADWEGPSSENPHTRKGLSISFFFFFTKKPPQQLPDTQGFSLTRLYSASFYFLHCCRRMFSVP